MSVPTSAPSFKQWEGFKAGLQKAAATCDREFPALYQDLLRQCRVLSWSPATPRAIWKRLLQQNVPLHIFSACDLLNNTDSSAQATARTALALHAASTVLQAAQTAGIIRQSSSSGSISTQLMMQQLQRFELLQLLPPLLMRLTADLKSAVHAAQRTTAAAAAIADGYSARQGEVAAAERCWLTTAAGAMQSLVCIVLRTWPVLSPVVGLEEFVLPSAECAVASLRFADMFLPPPQQQHQRQRQQEVGTPEIRLLVCHTVDALCYIRNQLKCALTQAAANASNQASQQLRTAYVQCWCWLLPMLPLGPHLQESHGCAQPADSSSGRGGGGASSSSSRGAGCGSTTTSSSSGSSSRGGGASSSTVAELPPALLKLLRRLGCSKKLACKGARRFVTKQQQPPEFYWKGISQHIGNYVDVDRVLCEWQGLVESAEGSACDWRAQHLRLMHLVQLRPEIKQQVQLNMLVPAVVLQWATELPTEAHEYVMLCWQATKAAAVANERSLAMLGDLQELHAQMDALQEQLQQQQQGRMEQQQKQERQGHAQMDALRQQQQQQQQQQGRMEQQQQQQELQGHAQTDALRQRQQQQQQGMMEQQQQQELQGHAQMDVLRQQQQEEQREQQQQQEQSEEGRRGQQQQEQQGEQQGKQQQDCAKGEAGRAGQLVQADSSDKGQPVAGGNGSKDDDGDDGWATTDSLPTGVLRDMQQLLCCLIPQFTAQLRSSWTSMSPSAEGSGSSSSKPQRNASSGSSSSSSSSMSLGQQEQLHDAAEVAAGFLLTVGMALISHKGWQFEADATGLEPAAAAAAAAAADTSAAAGMQGRVAQMHLTVLGQVCTVLQDYLRAKAAAVQCSTTSKLMSGISACLKEILLVGITDESDDFKVGPLVDLIILPTCDPVSPAALQLFGLLCSQLKLSTVLLQGGSSSGAQAAAQELSRESLKAVCQAAAAVVSACAKQGTAVTDAGLGAGAESARRVEAALPWVVLLGRCFLRCAQQLQEICRPTAPSSSPAAGAAGGPAAAAAAAGSSAASIGAAEATGASAAAAAAAAGAPAAPPASQWDEVLASVRSSAAAACALAACRSWLTATSSLQEAAALGCDRLALQQQVDHAESARRAALFAALRDRKPNQDTVSPVGFEAGTPDAAAVLDYVQQLHALGLSLTALPFPDACNNPCCSKVSGVSERQLVGGKSCLCGGCRTARYCSRECQKQHWQQHKPVCKALAAAGLSSV